MKYVVVLQQQLTIAEKGLAKFVEGGACNTLR